MKRKRHEWKAWASALVVAFIWHAFTLFAHVREIAQQSKRKTSKNKHDWAKEYIDCSNGKCCSNSWITQSLSRNAKTNSDPKVPKLLWSLLAWDTTLDAESFNSDHFDRQGACMIWLWKIEGKGSKDFVCVLRECLPSEESSLSSAESS